MKKIIELAFYYLFKIGAYMEESINKAYDRHFDEEMKNKKESE